MRKFWEIPLEALTPKEWEALCDGCAKCCHVFVHGKGRSTQPCALLNLKTNTCSDYKNRFERLGVAYGYLCKRVTPKLIESGNLPDSCAYVRRFKSIPLESWQEEKAKANYQGD